MEVTETKFDRELITGFEERGGKNSRVGLSKRSNSMMVELLRGFHRSEPGSWESRLFIGQSRTVLVVLFHCV